MSRRFNATLYFKSKESAMESGYCDAVHDWENDEFPYMSVVTFMADGYEIEEDDDLLEVNV